MNIIIADVFLVIGAAFLALGGLGILRMPDLYNRCQAGTKASTLGIFSILIGAGFMHYQWAPKLLLILVFIAITNPLSSSVLARAAYNAGVKPVDGTINEFEDGPIAGSIDGREKHDI